MAAPFIRFPRPKRVIVIGGGVAGIAALRALVEEDGPFDSVELMERRDNVGGVWYLNDEVVKQEKSYPGGTASGVWPIPAPEASASNFSNGASAQHSNGINGHSSSSSSATAKPSWPSPAYPALRGNVLPRFLSFSGAPPFPTPVDRSDPFPTLSETQDYLEAVAKPLQRHIRCSIEVVDVRELPGAGEESNRWAIRIRDWNKPGGPSRTEYADAVVLAVGWTDSPLYARLPGLQEAKQAGLVEHCKWYRGPEPYGTQSRILVVGNGNSGNDVAAQLAYCRTRGKDPVVYRVARHRAWYFYVSLPDDRIEDVPAIESFSLSSSSGAGVAKKVDVKLVDGRVLESIDRVIFASGYEIGKFPFVHLLSRQPSSSESTTLLPVKEDPNWNAAVSASSSTQADPNNSLWVPLSSPPVGTTFNISDNPERVPNLFWQVLHSRAATLALINLSVTSIPFLTSDLQSHLVRAVWDGSLSLPDRFADRLEYEEKRIRWLNNLRETKPERIKAAQERYIREQKDNKDGSYIPPEHTGVPPYHVLGTIVDDYGPPLRQICISAKSEWETKLPDWAAHSKERNAMYGLKRSTLQLRRDQGVNGV